MTKTSITIYRPEPKYDLEYYTQKVGRRVVDSDHPEERAEITASEEDEFFFERAYRSAITSISRSTKYYAGHSMYKTIRTEHNQTVTISDLEVVRKGNRMEIYDKTTKTKYEGFPSKYVLSFYQPYDVHADFEETLTTAVHDYLVYFALTDWFRVNIPAEVEACSAMAAAALETLVSLFSSVAPTKRWYNGQ